MLTVKSYYFKPVTGTSAVLLWLELKNFVYEVSIFPDPALDAVCEDSLPRITKSHVKDLWAKTNTESEGPVWDQHRSLVDRDIYNHNHSEWEENSWWHCDISKLIVLAVVTHRPFSFWSSGLECLFMFLLVS